MHLSCDEHDPDTTTKPFHSDVTSSEWELSTIGLIPEIEDSTRLVTGELDGVSNVGRDNADDDALVVTSSPIPLTVEATASVGEQPSAARALRMRTERVRSGPVRSATSKRGVKTRRESKSTLVATHLTRRHGITKRKSRKKIAIWEFLLQTIANVTYNPRLIEWKDINIGQFRINKGQELADLWAKVKGRRAKVKYASFARGLRYYYKRNFICKPDGTKMVYQFCDKTNWRKYLENHGSSPSSVKVREKTKNKHDLGATGSSESEYSQKHYGEETHSQSVSEFSQQHQIVEAYPSFGSELSHEHLLFETDSQDTSKLSQKHFTDETHRTDGVSDPYVHNTQADTPSFKSEQYTNIPQAVEVENQLLTHQHKLEDRQWQQKRLLFINKRLESRRSEHSVASTSHRYHDAHSDVTTSSSDTGSRVSTSSSSSESSVDTSSSSQELVTN